MPYCRLKSAYHFLAELLFFWGNLLHEKQATKRCISIHWIFRISAFLKSKTEKVREIWRKKSVQNFECHWPFLWIRFGT